MDWLSSLIISGPVEKFKCVKFASVLRDTTATVLQNVS